LKLSLLKAAMKEKPKINQTSSFISAQKYGDAETGKQFSQDTKIQILG